MEHINRLGRPVGMWSLACFWMALLRSRLGWVVVALMAGVGSAADSVASELIDPVGNVRLRIEDRAVKGGYGIAYAIRAAEMPEGHTISVAERLKFAFGIQTEWLVLRITNAAITPSVVCLDTGASALIDVELYQRSGLDQKTGFWQSISRDDTRSQATSGCKKAGSNRYWPLRMNSSEDRLIAIHARSLLSHELRPRLVSSIDRPTDGLALIACVIVAGGVAIFLLWTALWRSSHYVLIACNLVASLFWVNLLDERLLFIGEFLGRYVSPYGALTAAALFAGTYLIAYRQLLSDRKERTHLIGFKGWLAMALAAGLMLIMQFDLWIWLAIAWVIVATAPLCTLLYSSRIWRSHAPGSSAMLAAHCILLLLYLWQIYGVLIPDSQWHLGPVTQLFWQGGLVLHFVAWVSMISVNGEVFPRDISSPALGMLEREVDKRTEDLRIARENAERMAALQRNFLATMSHELRTPLASVVGLCRMLGGDKELPDRARKDMGTIERSAVHLLRMVDDGLAYVRQRGQEEPAARKPVDMRSLLRDMESVARWLSQRQDNEFVMLNARNVPPVLHFDEQRLRQILINLVSNAGRYCQNGRVSLGVAFSVIDQKPTLSWLVNDSGRGMSNEEMKKVFEPFVKSRDSEGLGLGLALVKKLVDDIGGSIRMQSQVGLGTQFYVSLPVGVENESSDDMIFEIPEIHHFKEAGVSRPMAFLPQNDLMQLRLDVLRQNIRLGQLSEIEKWMGSVALVTDLTEDTKRFLKKVSQYVADVDLAAIDRLIDQIDTPLDKV